jgi:hypothetical protein
MEGLIILVITIVVFIIGAVGFIIFGNRIRWPEGERLELMEAGKTVTLILGPNIMRKTVGAELVLLVGGEEIESSNLLKSIMKALRTSSDVFKERGSKVEINHYVVQYQSDGKFETAETFVWWNSWAKNHDAYSSYVGRQMWGKELHMAIIRERHIKTTVDRGQPVIHELIHAHSAEIGDAQRTHDNPELWAAINPANSIEIGILERWTKS